MSFLKIVLAMVVLSISFLNYAETKYTEVDLTEKENTELISFKINKSLDYYLDTKACLCVGWFSGMQTGAIDCKKLKVYPDIAKHLTNCK
jgi:hypothetical protein